MRLFFALWPPEPVAERLESEARMLAHRFGGKPTRQETVHVTLAFLGEVADGRLPEIVAAAARVSAAPFELRVDRLGYWRHNRLIWAGCSVVAPELQELADALREQLRAAGIACDESQRFVPHLTLLRKVGGTLSEDLPELPPLAWPCTHFVLVESRQAETGSDYLAIAEFPLGGG